MRTQDKLEIVNHSLEVAADTLGDITELVMNRYYNAHPGAKLEFDRLSFGNRSTRLRMEQSMIDSALYCFMAWYERPAEVDLTLQGASLQHNETKIPFDMVIGLLQATANVIINTIPKNDTKTLSVWDELQSTLTNIMKDSTISLLD